MSAFERYLTLWVTICIVAGIALGHLMPGVFQAIGAAEIAKVNESGVAPAKYYDEVVVGQGAQEAVMVSPFDD